LKKPLGRLAGAMFATAALTLTFAPAALAQEPDTQQAPTSGHGYINLNGRGVLVVSCEAGAPSDLATENLEVLAGPDQDGADLHLWNYEVKLVGDVKGKTSKFSWKCGGKPGQGIVKFEQAPPTNPPTTPPPTTTPTTTPSTPTTTVTSTTSTTKSKPATVKPQVKFAPQGGVETGFGGMAAN
jgi:hypothetical protein